MSGIRTLSMQFPFSALQDKFPFLAPSLWHRTQMVTSALSNGATSGQIILIWARNASLADLE
jgi:hypothetical protein